MTDLHTPVREPLTRSDAADATVSGVAILVVIAIAGWLSIREEPRANPGHPAVGRLIEAQGDIRRRSAESSGWQVVSAGDPTFEKDALFAGRNSEALLRMKTEAFLNLHPSSLVYVYSTEDATQEIELRHGDVLVRSAESPVSLRSQGKTFQLGSDSELTASRTEYGGRLQLLSGNVRITDGSGILASPGLIAITPEGSVETQDPFVIELTTPNRLARIPFVRSSPLRFAWSRHHTPVILQVAVESNFSSPLFESSAAIGASTVTVPLPAVGTYWWRLMTADRTQVSEARSFTVFAPRSAMPIFPAADETVYAPPGNRVTLQWTKVPFARNYWVELSREPGFFSPIVSERTRSDQLFISTDLAEGFYYWRVRAAHGDTPPPAVDGVRFAVQHTPLGEAPRVLGEEIRVHAD